MEYQNLKTQPILYQESLACCQETTTSCKGRRHSDTTRTNVFKYCAIFAYCEHVEKYHAKRKVTLQLSQTSNNTQKSKSIQVLCML